MSGNKVLKASRSADESKRSGAPRRLRTTVDHQRSEFLRLCRGRINPEDIGLPANRRARTGGLRREDVAALSGVSVSWYTWLEQGRDIRVSDEVLERLAQTFRLSNDERTFLFSLVQHRMPRAQAESDSGAPPEVMRMLQEVKAPAIAMNLFWEVVAWNDLNSVFYRDYAALPPSRRNLLELLFTQPVTHVDNSQLEIVARRLCARLRYDYSKYPDDPRFEALVRRLSVCSPLFNKLWRIPEFSLRAFGLYRFKHPRFGNVCFEHTSYMPDGYPQVRVVICTPEDDVTRRAVATAAAELARA